jgi:hypothetical protein
LNAIATGITMMGRITIVARRTNQLNIQLLNSIGELKQLSNSNETQTATATAIVLPLEYPPRSPIATAPKTARTDDVDKNRMHPCCVDGIATKTMIPTNAADATAILRVRPNKQTVAEQLIAAQGRTRIPSQYQPAKLDRHKPDTKSTLTIEIATKVSSDNAIAMSDPLAAVKRIALECCSLLIGSED